MVFGSVKYVDSSMKQYPHIWAKFKKICMDIYCLNRLDGMYGNKFENFQHWWLLYIYGNYNGNRIYNEAKNGRRE